MGSDPTVMRPIAVFDIDGTLYRGNSLTRLAERLCLKGFFPEGIAKLLFRYFLDRECREGSYRTNDERIIRTLLMGLRNRGVDEVMSEAKTFVAEAQGCVHEFPLQLLRTLKLTHDCIAVTGGLRETADGLAAEWGFDACLASMLETDGGKYTGSVATTPVSDKSAAVRKRMAGNALLTLAGSVGIGDTGSDIPVLEMVDTPIAFNPDSVLAQKAEIERWTIVLERKDNIYVINTGESLRFSVTEAVAAVSHVLHALRSLRTLQ